MKIRSGFISNSSSTSYVIAVTRDFQPTDEQVKKFVERYNAWEKDEDDLSIESGKEQIVKIVDRICREEEVWTSPEYDDKKDPLPKGIDVFEEIFEELHLVCMDGGPEDGRIINVLADKCKDKVVAQLKK